MLPTFGGQIGNVGGREIEMKKRIVRLFLPILALLFLSDVSKSRGLGAQGTVGDSQKATASEANIKAQLDAWTDFHNDFLAAAKSSDGEAISQFLETYIIEKRALEEALLFAPDSGLWLSTLVSANVLGELKGMATLDTGVLTLSDGSEVQLIIVLNSPSGGKKRPRYEDQLTLTRTLLDGTTQTLSVTQRVFLDSLGGNDFKASYTAKKSGLALSKAEIEGFVDDSNSAVIVNHQFRKYVYDAIGERVGGIEYHHTDSRGYTVDLKSMAHYLGATGSRTDSLARLQNTICP